MSHRVAFAFLLITFVCSCAERPTIRADWDKQADFSKYSTYNYAEVISSNNGQDYDSLSTKYLKVAVAPPTTGRECW